MPDEVEVYLSETPAENTADAIYLHKTFPVGEMSFRAKLTNESVREIRLLRGLKLAGDIAAEYGVSIRSIYSIFQGKTWKQIQ